MYSLALEVAEYINDHNRGKFTRREVEDYATTLYNDMQFCIGRGKVCPFTNEAMECLKTFEGQGEILANKIMEAIQI